MIFPLQKTNLFTLTRNLNANGFHSEISFNEEKLVLFIYLN